MNEITGRFEASEASITPEILAATIKVVGMDGSFLIRGIACDVRPYRINGDVKAVYGLLRLGGAAVGFRTSPECAPREGEAVVMSAAMKIKPAKQAGRDRWRADFQIELIAAKIGTWTPQEADASLVRLGVRPDRTPLQGVVEERGAAALTVLVSATAEADILQSLTQAGLVERPVILRADFSDAAAVIKAAEQAVASGCRGMALARGGGVGLELIANSPQVTQAMIDLDVPFYSAMGHGDDIFLMDKYADQSFHTPSALGAAIAQAAKSVTIRAQEKASLASTVRQKNLLSETLQVAQASEAEAQQKAADLSSALTQRVYRHAHGVSLSWPVLTGAAVAVLAILAILAFAAIR